MNKKQQDELWNELSEETRQDYKERYEFHLADSKREIECNDGGYDLTVLRSQTIVRELENMFGTHNLNHKPLTYKDVAMELYNISVGTFGIPERDFNKKSDVKPCDYFGVYSKEAQQKVIAIIKLINVAKYLNGDWKPDWNDTYEDKFYIYIKEVENKKIGIANNQFMCNSPVYFRTKELAQRAIQILGEETIRLALSNDY